MKILPPDLYSTAVSVLEGDESESLGSEAPDQVAVGRLHVLSGQSTAHALYKGKVHQKILAIEIRLLVEKGPI
jgi:hypothetical protein